jgi:hypothetical protein
MIGEMDGTPEQEMHIVYQCSINLSTLYFLSDHPPVLYFKRDMVCFHQMKQEQHHGMNSTLIQLALYNLKERSKVPSMQMYNTLIDLSPILGFEIQQCGDDQEFYITGAIKIPYTRTRVVFMISMDYASYLLTDRGIADLLARKCLKEYYTAVWKKCKNIECIAKLCGICLTMQSANGLTIVLLIGCWLLCKAAKALLWHYSLYTADSRMYRH